MSYLRIVESNGPDSRGIGEPRQQTCLAVPQVPTGTTATRGQIQFVELRNFQLSTSGGRKMVSFSVGGPMDDKKRASFIRRFMEPMNRYPLSRKLCHALHFGTHPVLIAWGNGQFGINGTSALDRREAVGGRGSAAVIYIDENAPDWQGFETIVANPDVGLFHELIHAWYTQRGAVVNEEEEMERLVIGIGRHLNCPLTENAYREARNLARRCCWKKEKL
ncbi:MAG TPA: hypothetical protein VFG14_16225 [Chthoniobacteraceae bacterium]|nr:hypothetical protein [Chthoniobacteraceae bacterium]